MRGALVPYSPPFCCLWYTLMFMLATVILASIASFAWNENLCVNMVSHIIKLNLFFLVI